MTKEEAAEELLEDDPYIQCLTCSGIGYVPGVEWDKACDDCFQGKLIRRRYVQACQLLQTFPRRILLRVAEDQ